MSLKLYSWNVNGIRANIKRGTFQQFLEKENPDIICLQETRMPNEITPMPELDDYHQYWGLSDRPGYSGTAILTKQKPLSSFEGFTDAVYQKYHKQMVDEYGDATKEGRIVNVEFKDFWVISVYTPNSKVDLTRLPFRYNVWDPAFFEHVMELSKTKPVLAGGDYNVAHNEIDLARPKQNRGKHGFTDEERERFSQLIDAGAVDSFRLLYPDKTEIYSWWSHYAKSRERNVGWRIDYWLMTDDSKKYIKDATVHPEILGSDHCPVSIIIDGMG